jgi:hypothetical protein
MPATSRRMAAPSAGTRPRRWTFYAVNDGSLATAGCADR